MKKYQDIDLVINFHALAAQQSMKVL